MTRNTQPRSFTWPLVASLAVLVCTGCGSFPKESDAKTQASFEQPLERAQKAATEALAMTGFEIKTQEPGHLEGARPRKVGAFVGSGGEKVGVWLTALTPNRTEVKVKTNQSFTGRAGQKDWDSEIIAQMTRTLAQ